MADAQKVISANPINQCSAVVGYNKTDPTSKHILSVDKTQLGINHIASGNAERYDDYGLRRKTIEIGSWDMDTDGIKKVTHDLPPGAWANTRSVDLAIQNDSQDFIHDDNDAEADVAISGVNSTQVVLSRTPSGKFDDAAYDDSAINRGWLTVWYE